MHLLNIRCSCAAHHNDFTKKACKIVKRCQSHAEKKIIKAPTSQEILSLILKAQDFFPCVCVVVAPHIDIALWLQGSSCLSGASQYLSGC